MLLQESTTRLGAFLNEVLPGEGWNEVTQRQEELVQVVIFLYQLLHQSDPNTSDPHFRYFFRWSQVGPFSEQLMDAYRRMRGAPIADESVDYSELNDEQRKYAAIVRQLIEPPGEMSELRWVQSIGMIAYLCSVYRLHNKNPTTASRAAEKAQNNLGISAAVTDKAVARLREEDLIPANQEFAI